MLFIQHNLIAQNANRQLNVTMGRNSKTTEKLSSGYRINRAADDAAGLAISEKMRRQIRGLTQGTANARDGVSYVQVADGAMDEGHAILHRMNELALKSLNGTLTESDRAALNAEFDQLRTEIDRINSDTEFNEQKVFDKHEPSYYQIEGNIRWNDNQLHTIPTAANELKINLPNSYVPNEYVITVPAGVYTTQELIDEIDDALTAMTPPNPGFVFEYTDKGYCNLNFERADGTPAKIASVEGSLAYLLYDLYGGSSSGDLLGTSVFETSHPFTIYKGQNDELIFYIESASGSERVKMTIPPGEYTRSGMIDRINQELAKYPNAAGVTAKEYGDSYIQVTGGRGVSINGLKGNMFKYESATSKYSSVFYDNVQYGVSGGKNATITGAAFSYGSVTTDIDIVAGVNDTLSFQLNDRAGSIEVGIPAGKYTISEIATLLTNRFKDMGIDKEITAEASYSSVSPYGYRLRLSSTMKGSKSRLEFNTAKAVHENTYNSLFRITNYNLQRSTRQKASFVGSAYHTGKINLSGDASLTFDVDGKSYTVDGIGGTYDNINSLITTLNNKLAANYPALKDKVKFTSSSNRLMIAAQNDDINQINFTQKNNTYKQLFENLYVSMSYTSTMGSIKYQQGSSATEEIDATITVAIPADKQSGPITIDKDSCTMSFSSNTSSTGTITLTAKTYGNMQELVAEINNKLKSNSNSALKVMQASYSGGKLIFTSPPRADSYRLYLENHTSTSSAWKNIFGVRYNVNGPTSYAAGKSTVTTYSAIAESTTIDSTNNTLTLNIGKGDITINIASGNYTSRDALKNAVQSAIDGNPDLKDNVDVSITSDNKLRLSLASGSTLEVKGSFHDGVLISKITRDISNYVKDGSYSDTDYTKAFIIGRKDLTGEPVEIVSDANDEFSFDFTYKSASSFANGYEISMDVKIPAGIYKGDELAKVLQEKIQEKFTEKGLADFVIKVTIGGENTHVANSNDDTALQIAVNRKAGTEPTAGEYILDGIRGSAASFIFYKTTTEPRTTYITGTKDLAGGISFQPGQNVLTLSADSKPYQYTFPEGVTYTAEEFSELLNDMFANGDDNGNTAPLKASIENGVLRITHKVMGSHTITDVGGSARNTIFYNESGRDSRKPLTILVSGEAGDNIEIPRVSVGSCALRINSITISRPKYAEKAVRHIKEAINLLSSKRSIYGAIQNRLEHTINNNNNIVENTQVSESAIRDADVADLMMEHSVNHILRQAGTSMLTQANQSSRLILELLR